MFSFEPIGRFHSSAKERYELPRQPGQGVGYIQLQPHCNYEQALADLADFDRIWVLFLFHENHSWKPKVMPPRGGVKRGVFATRSPHRPNPIGLSCVELSAIEGLKLYVGDHDLLDGTPILDIKPYIVYADSFPEARQGWLEDLESEAKYSIVCSVFAQRQLAYLKKHWDLDILASVQQRLSTAPYPYAGARIGDLGEGVYELAYKSWRLRYRIQATQVTLDTISSGYSDEALQGDDDPWGDIEIHRKFVEGAYERD